MYYFGEIDSINKQSASRELSYNIFFPQDSTKQSKTSPFHILLPEQDEAKPILQRMKEDEANMDLQQVNLNEETTPNTPQSKAPLRSKSGVRNLVMFQEIQSAYHERKKQEEEERKRSSVIIIDNEGDEMTDPLEKDKEEALKKASDKYNGNDDALEYRIDQFIDSVKSVQGVSKAIKAPNASSPIWENGVVLEITKRVPSSTDSEVTVPETKRYFICLCTSLCSNKSMVPNGTNDAGKIIKHLEKTGIIINTNLGISKDTTTRCITHLKECHGVLSARSTIRKRRKEFQDGRNDTAKKAKNDVLNGSMQKLSGVTNSRNTIKDIGRYFIIGYTILVCLLFWPFAWAAHPQLKAFHASHCEYAPEFNEHSVRKTIVEIYLHGTKAIKDKLNAAKKKSHDVPIFHINLDLWTSKINQKILRCKNLVF